MDEEVYVRVFPWRSSEARLSRAADGNSRSTGKGSRDGRREKGHRDGIAAFLLTTGSTQLPRNKKKKKPPALNKTLSSLEGTSCCVKYA